MFKGYKSERAYYNAKIHGMACIIYSEGADDFLRESITQIINRRPASLLFENKNSDGGVSSLTDQEAKSFFNELLAVTKRVKANMETTGALLGVKTNQMTDVQRKKIIKLTRYIFKWSIDVSFSKITEYCPDLLKRLTTWQIKNTKIQPLFNLISRTQADHIIKILEQIEKRNKNEKN
ncbi:MAG: hypothetical protein HGGPFJEG_03088 [Ignavibacteria bacterium]|nr:hypothetical protein [Ignavibacteria bacterium]